MRIKTGYMIITVLLLSTIYIKVIAGSSLDYGTVPGTPPVGQVNWLAWLDKTIQPGGYPSIVMTEDSTNPGIGTNQGYQVFDGTPRWLLQVAQHPNPVYGDSVTILLGGLGASSGNGWRDNFTWQQNPSLTDQGEAATESSFNACPVMNFGSQNETGKTINWSGPSSQYLIYRSQTPSSVGNGASDGRYYYVDNVLAGEFTYQDGDCAEGTNCWHIVVPANGSGVINGCHSEETNPTAITLTTFQAVSFLPAFWLLMAGVALLAFTALTLVVLRKRALSR